MSAPIPADILEAALKLSSWTFGSSDDKDVMEVAAALLAEREACAKLCEGDFDSEMASYGRYFAAAIRNPHAVRK